MMGRAGMIEREEGETMRKEKLSAEREEMLMTQCDRSLKHK